MGVIVWRGAPVGCRVLHRDISGFRVPGRKPRGYNFGFRMHRHAIAIQVLLKIFVSVSKVGARDSGTYTDAVGRREAGRNALVTAKRIWHIYDRQGQILALALRYKSTRKTNFTNFQQREN